MPLKRTVSIAVLCVACSVAVHAKDIALVANKGNGVDSVSQAELLRIAKGAITHWPDGKPVTLVLRIPASQDMKLVLQKLYGMQPEEVNLLIATANHERVDTPAFVIVNSDEAVVKKVTARPGAVGLVDVYSITGGVTVMRVGGKLPLEPGYLLHSN